MPRFVTVQVQCDWADCSTVAEEGDGTVEEMTVAIDGKQAKGFLLCKPHREDLDEVLMPLMQAGIKVETPKTRRSSPRSKGGNGSEGEGEEKPTGGGAGAQTFECQVKDCGRTLHNRTGMAQHVIRTHGFPSLAVYEERFPQQPDNHE
jgi:hypothetical protein